MLTSRDVAGIGFGFSFRAPAARSGARWPGGLASIEKSKVTATSDRRR